MSVLVQDTLKSPMGNILPGVIIRVTALEWQGQVPIESQGEYTSDASGDFSFTLLNGSYLIEVVSTDTYIENSRVIVDIATPSPITLSELIEYSTEVAPAYIPYNDSAWNYRVETELEDADLTTRSKIDQISDGDTYTHNRKQIHTNAINGTLITENDLIVEAGNARSKQKTVSYATKNGSHSIQKATVGTTQGALFKDILESSFDNASGKSVSYGERSLESSEGTSYEKIIITDSQLTGYGFTAKDASYVSDVLILSENFPVVDQRSVSTDSMLFTKLVKQENGHSVTGPYVNKDIVTSREIINLRGDFDPGNVIDETTIYIDAADNTIATHTEGIQLNNTETKNVRTSNGAETSVSEYTDKFTVGVEGNTPTFTVNTKTNEVTINGKLNIDNIEDFKGDSGDTIFEVFQYSADGVTDWHTTWVFGDNYRRHGTSTNGVLSGYSEAYLINAKDGVDGDTLYIAYSYSSDKTNWHTVFVDGDIWRRERTILNNIPQGIWSEPGRIIGSDGADGEITEIVYQYSVDGFEPWHSNFSTGDHYRRERVVYYQTTADRDVENYYQASAWSSPSQVVPISGVDYTDGLSQVVVYLYKRSSTGRPLEPTQDLIYDFTAKSLVGDLEDWSQAIPSGSSLLWVTAATASSSTTTDTIAASEWITPEVMGGSSYNQANLNLFQRSTTIPTAPVATLTYDYTTGLLSGDLGNWTFTTIPEGTADLYLATASVVSQDTTVEVITDDWGVGLMSTKAFTQETVHIYKRSTTVPSAPTNDVTYNFTTGVLTGLTGDWSTTLPSGTDNVYIGVALASSSTNTDTITSANWSVGLLGASGTKATIINLYKDALSEPVLPSATSIYDFSTKKFTTAPNNGWSTTFPVNTTGKIWITTGVASASALANTDSIPATEWTTPEVFLESGVQTGYVNLYRISATTLTDSNLPQVNLTYSFLTGTLTSVPAGWSLSMPTNTGVDAMWVTSASVTTSTVNDTDIIYVGEWTTPTILVRNGTTLYDIYEYSVTGSSLWHSTFVTGDIYRRTAQYKDGVQSAWSNPVKISGIDGIQAVTVNLYKIGTVTPVVPTANITYTFANGNLTGDLQGWSKTIPSNIIAGGTVWNITNTALAYASATSDILSPSDWSSPVVVIRNGTDGIKGDNGLDGEKGTPGVAGTSTYFHIAYADDVNGLGFSQNPYGKGYLGTYVDSIEADSTDTSKYTWVQILGATGDQGVAGNTIWYAYQYSTNASSWHTTYATNDVYRRESLVTNGVYGTWSAAARISGIQGIQGIQGADGEDGIAGADGTSSYFHIAYADSSTGSGFSQTATNKSYIGTYVDTTAADAASSSALWNWQLVKGLDGTQGLAGTNGSNGQTSYLHIAYATNATGTTGFSTTDSAGKTYIGQYTDFTSADSTTATKYKWTLIKGDTGTAGSTTYFHVAYADSITGTGLTFTATGKAYMGTYVDFTSANSTTASKYTWSLIKGTDGANGTAGTNGINGETSYLHIAYATNSTGSAGFSTTDSTGKTYIGQYTDFTLADSTTASKYKWTLIKGDTGATGATGVTGATGASGTTYYTWIKYSTSADGTNPVDTPTATTLYIGIAYNKTTATQSTVKTDYTWSKFVGATGVTGSTGATGATLYTWIKYSNSADGTSPVDSPVGMAYMGIAYNKTTATESTTKTDYSWTKILGDTGATGLTGSSGTNGTNGTNGVDGVSLVSEYVWDFMNTTDAWTFTNSTVTTNAGYLTLVSTTADPTMNMNTALGLSGAQNNLVSIRMRNTGATFTSTIQVYYKTASHGISGSYYKSASVTYPSNEWIVVTLDMSSLTAGTTDWTNNTITALRVDPVNTSGKTLEIDYILVGRVGSAQTSYLHIAYADDVVGNGFSQDPDNKIYIGTYVDFTATDSSDKTKYTWSRYTGQNGTNGTNGTHGSGSYVIQLASASSIPNDTGKNADIITNSGRAAQAGDILTYTSTTAATTKFSKSYLRGASSWTEFKYAFDGDVIVDGTLAGEKLQANAITGDKISSTTTITAGSGTTQAGMNGDDATASIYKGYRFWAGGSDPATAPFRVTDKGEVIANNLNAQLSSIDYISSAESDNYIRDNGLGSPGDTQAFMHVRTKEAAQKQRVLLDRATGYVKVTTTGNTTWKSLAGGYLRAFDELRVLAWVKSTYTGSTTNYTIHTFKTSEDFPLVSWSVGSSRNLSVDSFATESFYFSIESSSYGLMPVPSNLLRVTVEFTNLKVWSWVDNDALNIISES